MAISTYTELQAAVKSWLHRASLGDSNISDAVPDLITVGEARINREVRSLVQEQRSTSTLSGAYINVPSDLLEIRSVWVTTGGIAYKLDYATPDALFVMYPDTSGSGIPKWYTIIGDEIRFGPVPDSGYTVEIWYIKRLSALSSSGNTLFTNYPDLYLYAALAAAVLYAKDDKRIDVWESQYRMVRDSINSAEERGRRGQAMQMVAA